ncbi:N-acetylglucosamine-6-phosphate deacetylase [Enterocloster asparagiformis]|uniref:N-acetylglucosamine-6-phosphate deacetylase n=1 Tax=Enterocloster asparagiformis TaxID=333367 RepID=UPI000463F6E5|nr:N-acetylglucosamine-6-phosphate deacetylase [Enterocloster asparagiformis]
MTKLLFYNGIILSEHGEINDGYLTVSDGIIERIGKGTPPALDDGYRRVDLNHHILSPGFIDTHTHGAGGADFMDGTLEAFLTACRMHLTHGTTSIMPTSMSCFDDELFQLFDCFEQAKPIRENMPHLLGLHLEGPYFSPEQAGAQPAECMTVPFPHHFDKIIGRSGGNIRRWSSAPEVPGVIELGDTLIKLGILPSIAHSDADYDVVRKAFDAGYHHLTHFYSGMSTIHRKNGYRILGVVESGYLLDDMHIEIICDGIHLPPELLELIFKLKDHDHITLVTDSMRAAGMPEGPTVLGSLKYNFQCVAENGVAKMPDRSCFAGSTATADRMIRVLVKQLHMPLWDAVKFMTQNPAKLCHIFDWTGSLSVGKNADLLVFDSDINIEQVYVSGVRMGQDS